MFVEVLHTTGERAFKMDPGGNEVEIFLGQEVDADNLENTETTVVVELKAREDLEFSLDF